MSRKKLGRRQLSWWEESERYQARLKAAQDRVREAWGTGGFDSLRVVLLEIDRQDQVGLWVAVGVLSLDPERLDHQEIMAIVATLVNRKLAAGTSAAVHRRRNLGVVRSGPARGGFSHGKSRS